MCGILEQMDVVYRQEIQMKYTVFHYGGYHKMCLRKAINQMYKGCEELIIIGLTGRTGSGCSTVAKILESDSFEQLDLKQCKAYDFSTTEERKNRVIYEYMAADRWKKFSVVEVSSIILASALELGVDPFIEYIEKITLEAENTINIGDKSKVIHAIRQINYMFQKCEEYSLNKLDTGLHSIDKSKIEEYYIFYTKTVKDYKRRFKDILDGYSCYEIYSDKFKGKQQSQYHLYTYLLQQMGNNIRCSGNPFNSSFSGEKYQEFVKKIDKIIEIIVMYNKNTGEHESRICIDAIRNQYEAMFFKDKYKAFHLMAVSTEDTDRKQRLKELNTEELINLDKIEYAQKMQQSQEIFYHQNIQGCLEYADIHIYNPNVTNRKYYLLTEQIVKYVALMLHPGLITPTSIERCMQLAYNAKFNSGCLSRQVGAVVTRDDYSIQAIGWNDVPKGQISCNLRDVGTFCKNKDKETYSQYEIENPEFNQALNRINKETAGKTDGRCMPYCFKDVYNGLKRDKNQVYTRSLHAEENAFLQISKYGGTHVKDGYLFCTASPCELCAKKAYQLGIKCIYYIDPYPGISQQHILSFGTENNPEMKLFFGAIGRAYLDFYEPRIATKDELEMLTGVNIKDIVGGDKEENTLEYGDLVYNEIINELKFNGDRNNIDYFKTINATVKRQDIKRFSRKIFWTGSAYDGTKIIQDESDSDLSLNETSSTLPYTYDIVIETPRSKDDKLQYKILTCVKDEKHVMEPYLAHMVKNDTNKLVLRVITPKDMITDVIATVYADLDMKIRISESKITEDVQDENEIYEKMIENANVNYTYAIEWKFKGEK